MFVLYLILLSLFGIIILGTWASQSELPDVFTDIIGPVIIIFGFAGLFFYIILAFDYVASEYRMKLINEEYNTNYTQEEVFFAHDIIKKVNKKQRSD